MGKINKALNRSNFKNTHKPSFGQGNHFQQRFQEREQNREEKKDLKLIDLDSSQQDRKDIKFVFKLPQTTKSVKKLLEEAQSDGDKLIILQRVRDYYNPILEPKHTDKFKQFVVCLIAYYLQQDIESEAVCSHLKELCSQFGALFSAYLKSKLTKILQVLKELRDSALSEDLDKLLGQVVDCQALVINVLEFPNNSKLLEVLEQTVGHVYQMSDLFMGESQLMLNVVQNDILICGRLHKKFNPAISMVLIKMMNDGERGTDFKVQVQDMVKDHLRGNH
ncbi:hypothetical protein FGO68_gene6793 [Halteria grandinella]|uniref:Uncharacterized protein n=1 Tax=Halteria grandinella TaxID=5974 RepID=A0A8J8NNI4_HALGN|nr:hypothetical protein FGO68_gene6793 [Halteria grandinella]